MDEVIAKAKLQHPVLTLERRPAPEHVLPLL